MKRNISMHRDLQLNQSPKSNPRFSANRTLVVFVVVCLAISRQSLFAAEQKLDGKFSNAFNTLDTNNDKKLSSDEFCANKAEANIAKRDFRIFDSNRDGFL